MTVTLESVTSTRAFHLAVNEINRRANRFYLLLNCVFSIIREIPFGVLKKGPCLLADV